MKLTLDFKKLGKNNTDIAGGKGASLGEMTQAGIPVPPGFVVLSTTFDEFIKELDLAQEIDAILDKVNHKDINSVEVASEKIQALIKNVKMPERIEKDILENFKQLDTEFVAVRSSATAEDGADNAWAGQLDSYLNTKEENLLEKVQHCWASLFTPRAIFYRFEKGLHNTKISVAVVVQKMINSEISGIAFSVHPVTEDRNQMIIEAGFGLGEAIVSGQITPDSYVVEKEPRRIIDTNVSTQSRGLYRVQTGGNEWIDISEPKASSRVLTEKQILEFADIIMRIENHYGFPCDIEWAYEDGKFYIVQSRPITTLSLKGSDSFTKESIVDKFLHDMRDTSIEKQEGNMSIAIMGNICEVVKDKYLSPYYGINFGDILVLQKDKGGIIFFSLENYRKSSWFSFKKSLKLKSPYELEEYKDYLKVKDEVFNLYQNKKIPSDQNELYLYIDHLFDLECKLLATTLFSESMDHDLAYEMAQSVAIKDIENFLSYATLPAFESFVVWQNELIAQGNQDRWMLADQYGVPTIDEAINIFKKNLEETSIEKIQKEVDDQKIKTKENNTKINEFKKTLTGESLNLFEYIQMSMELRDRRKETTQKTITLIVDALTILAEQHSLSYHDISFVTREELKKLKDPSFIKEINKRKETGVILLVRNEGLESEATIYDEIKNKVTQVMIKGVGELRGVTAQPGRVTGVAKVILNEKDFALFNEGDVLVTSMTRPEFIPIMKKASAVITDEGGVTCHAAIISRELGIPCIIGTRSATILIKTGDFLEVDADSGVIKVIK